MITKIYTVEQLKSLIAELFYNKTTRVTAASDESVINALFYGAAKIGQKAMKDIALVESHIFPQYAYGSNLDNAAAMFGVPSRYEASGSSTYLLIRALEGTTYEQATHTFSGENGITFELTDDFTMGVDGFGYVKVRSVEIGKITFINNFCIFPRMKSPGLPIKRRNQSSFPEIDNWLKWINSFFMVNIFPGFYIRE